MNTISLLDTSTGKVYYFTMTNAWRYWWGFKRMAAETIFGMNAVPEGPFTGKFSKACHMTLIRNGKALSDAVEVTGGDVEMVVK